MKSKLVLHVIAGSVAAIALLCAPIALAQGGAGTGTALKPTPPTIDCSHFPKGGKGPAGGAEKKATVKCWETIRSALDAQSSTLNAEAKDCAKQDQPFRDSIGAGYDGVATSWQNQIKDSRKSQARYWKNEAEWYRDKKSNKAGDKADKVVDAVGKSAFAADGFPSALKAAGSALRNGDCGEVARAAADGAKAVTKLDDAIGELKSAVDDIK